MKKSKQLIALAMCLLLTTPALAMTASPKCARVIVQWNAQTPSTGGTGSCANATAGKTTQTPSKGGAGSCANAAAGKTAEVSTTGSAKSTLADEVISQVNAERAKAGLKPLKVSAELTRAACVRAREIVVKFSHTRPSGASWSTVSSAVYGENIAKGQRTADKVMAAWMSSQGHRANILRSSYGSIGVCAYVSGGVTYWVQLFGK